MKIQFFLFSLLYWWLFDEERLECDSWDILGSIMPLNNQGKPRALGALRTEQHWSVLRHCRAPQQDFRWKPGFLSKSLAKYTAILLHFSFCWSVVPLYTQFLRLLSKNVFLVPPRTSILKHICVCRVFFICLFIFFSLICFHVCISTLGQILVHLLSSVEIAGNQIWSLNDFERVHRSSM